MELKMDFMYKFPERKMIKNRKMTDSRWKKPAVVFRKLYYI